MIAGLFVMYGREYARLCKILNKNIEAEKAYKHVDEMVKAVMKYGWDGNWFLRAYDYWGRKIGSEENEEGKIFIESNGWCAMAQIGLEEGKSFGCGERKIGLPVWYSIEQPGFFKVL